MKSKVIRVSIFKSFGRRCVSVERLLPQTGTRTVKHYFPNYDTMMKMTNLCQKMLCYHKITPTLYCSGWSIYFSPMIERIRK